MIGRFEQTYSVGHYFEKFKVFIDDAHRSFDLIWFYKEGHCFTMTHLDDDASFVKFCVRMRKANCVYRIHFFTLCTLKRSEAFLSSSQKIRKKHKNHSFDI